MKTLIALLMLTTPALANDWLQGGNQWLGGNQGNHQSHQQQNWGNQGQQEMGMGGMGRQCAQTQCVTNGGFQNCFCTMWR